MKRESACDLIHTLSRARIKTNVTVILTLGQVCAVTAALGGGAPSNISVFAGRGVDPGPIMAQAVRIARAGPDQLDLRMRLKHQTVHMFADDAAKSGFRL
jgi:transaldolase